MPALRCWVGLFLRQNALLFSGYALPSFPRQNCYVRPVLYEFWAGARRWCSRWAAPLIPCWRQRTCFVSFPAAPALAVTFGWMTSLLFLPIGWCCRVTCAAAAGWEQRWDGVGHTAGCRAYRRRWRKCYGHGAPAAQKGGMVSPQQALAGDYDQALGIASLQPKLALHQKLNLPNLRPRATGVSKFPDFETFGTETCYTNSPASSCCFPVPSNAAAWARGCTCRVTATQPPLLESTPPPKPPGVCSLPEPPNDHVERPGISAGWQVRVPGRAIVVCPPK